jgi:hypothetical protein
VVPAGNPFSRIRHKPRTYAYTAREIARDCRHENCPLAVCRPHVPWFSRCLLSICQSVCRHAAPVFDLLKKEHPRDFTALADKALASFRRLQAALQAPTVLALPRDGWPDAEFLLRCDASQGQLGCVLLQRQPDRDFQPVGHWSRKLNDAEKKYNATEREALAIVLERHVVAPVSIGIQICGRIRSCCVHTLFRHETPHRRLTKWQLALSDYVFDFRYRP